MFEDSLLESGGKDSKLHRRGPWATVFSFVLQVGLLGVLVLIPLIFTEALPKQQLMGYLVAPPPPPPPPPPPAAATPVTKAAPKPVVTEIDNGRLKAPTKIPPKITRVVEDETPASSGGGVPGGVVGGVPGGQAGGVPGGVLNSIVSSTPTAVPKAATPRRITVSSGVTAGLLARKVQPTYPPLARQARVSGSVVLQAVISKSGSIENLKVISGHPMLVQSALDAVRQWKYRPYFLNGEPVEVDTTITVNFTLGS